ncbi:unnamed protein product [Prorocentrum cordatum]|uniref:Uncharacterized protein n=1 Tax=Prorocentrum cordatum TaxID=2364126 RepID=A0ABN9XJN4_9DINO|nr:unnamed protein product [Polarella glacialis]
MRESPRESRATWIEYPIAMQRDDVLASFEHTPVDPPAHCNYWPSEICKQAVVPLFVKQQLNSEQETLASRPPSSSRSLQAPAAAKAAPRCMAPGRPAATTAPAAAPRPWRPRRTFAAPCCPRAPSGAGVNGRSAAAGEVASLQRAAGWSGRREAAPGMGCVLDAGCRGVDSIRLTASFFFNAREEGRAPNAGDLSTSSLNV